MVTEFKFAVDSASAFEVIFRWLVHLMLRLFVVANKFVQQLDSNIERGMEACVDYCHKLANFSVSLLNACRVTWSNFLSQFSLQSLKLVEEALLA